MHQCILRISSKSSSNQKKWSTKHWHQKADSKAIEKKVVLYKLKAVAENAKVSTRTSFSKMGIFFSSSLTRVPIHHQKSLNKKEAAAAIIKRKKKEEESTRTQTHINKEKREMGDSWENKSRQIEMLMMITITTSINNCSSSSSPSSSLFIDLTSIDWVNRKRERGKDEDKSWSEWESEGKRKERKQRRQWKCKFDK